MGAQSPVCNESRRRSEKQHQLSSSLISLVDILGTGAWRGLSRVPVSGSFSLLTGADMISGIKDRSRWQYYIVARRVALWNIRRLSGRTRDIKEVLVSIKIINQSIKFSV